MFLVVWDALDRCAKRSSASSPAPAAAPCLWRAPYKICTHPTTIEHFKSRYEHVQCKNREGYWLTLEALLEVHLRSDHTPGTQMHGHCHALLAVHPPAVMLAGHNCECAGQQDCHVLHSQRLHPLSAANLAACMRCPAIERWGPDLEGYAPSAGSGCRRNAPLS